MWIVGWAFYWIGTQKEGRGIAPPASKRENFKLISAAALEEEPVGAKA
jgi:hypothetical protein